MTMRAFWGGGGAIVSRLWYKWGGCKTTVHSFLFFLFLQTEGQKPDITKLLNCFSPFLSHLLMELAGMAEWVVSHSFSSEFHCNSI